MEHAKRQQPEKEQGFALILAILALMLLTFLGLTLATTTATELQIASNYRWGQQALYNAEAGIEAGRLTLARRAAAATAWSNVLPTARPGSWLVEDPTVAPLPSEPQVGRDYWNQDCDLRGNMGYGRVLRDVAGNALENVQVFDSRTLNGAFTIWIRRGLEVNENGYFSDSRSTSNVVLTVEGVAPFLGVGDERQAVRVLEVPLRLDVESGGDSCGQLVAQEGMGPTGDNFDPCSALTAESLREVFGDVTSTHAN